MGSEPLARMLVFAGGMSVDEVVEVFLPIVDAVRVSHTGAIGRRELDPEKIVVTETGGRYEVEVTGADGEVDEGEDIRRLGALLQAALSAERTKASRSVEGLGPDVPTALAEIVRRMLERDREKQPTLAEVRAALLATTHPEEKPARPLTAVLLGVSLAAALLGSALVSQQIRGSRDTREPKRLDPPPQPSSEAVDAGAEAGRAN